jgi:prefoldin subunit 5
MTQAKEPSDYDRQLRQLNRRLERLEDTQISPQEFGRGLDRVYAEIDALRSEMREMKMSMMEMNSKFDIIMRYIAVLILVRYRVF